MTCEMMSIISSIYDFPLITGESHMLLSPVYYEGKVIYDGYMTSFSMTYIFTCGTKEMNEKLKFVHLKISHTTKKKKKKIEDRSCKIKKKVTCTFLFCVYFICTVDFELILTKS